MTHYYKDLDMLLVNQCLLKQTNKQIQKCLSQHDDSVRQLLFLPPKYSIKGAILLYLPTLPGQLKAE